MTDKSLFKLTKKAAKEGFVNLDNGFKIVSKDWMIKNIIPSNISKEDLAKELDCYAWREIDSSFLVQFFLKNKELKCPDFYLLDKDNFVYSDSFNIDFPYDIENISGTRCYVLTYYNRDDMKVIELGYMAKSVAEEIFSMFANLYNDVSIYTLKDDTSYDADNIDDKAWSKIS